MIDYLLELGADIDADGLFPCFDVISHAAVTGQVDAIRHLVRRGAVIRQQPGCDSPLHEAAQHGSVETAAYLISQGLDVDWRGTADQTPLQRAVSFGNLEMVKFLVAEGADPRASDGHYTIEDWARMRGYSEILEYLQGLPQP